MQFLVYEVGVAIVGPADQPPTGAADLRGMKRQAASAPIEGAAKGPEAPPGEGCFFLKTGSVVECAE